MVLAFPRTLSLQDAIDRDQKDVSMKTPRNSAAALPFAPIRAADATQFTFCHFALAVGLALCCSAGWAETNSDIGPPAAVIPLSDEAPPRLVVYPPLAEPLARGVVIIQYRTENIRIIPVFGDGALSVSPRVGHLHVTVDDRPGTWAHTSDDPIIVVGLQPGLHMMRIEVANPVHKILATEIIGFSVPGQGGSAPHKH